jgi:hypothetical protein
VLRGSFWARKVSALVVEGMEQPEREADAGQWFPSASPAGRLHMEPFEVDDAGDASRIGR